MSKQLVVTKWSQESVDTICSQVRSSKSLRTICMDETLPDYEYVLERLEGDQEFQERMAKALLTMLMAETTEIMERANTAGGEFALDPVDIAKAKLEIDTRLRLLREVKGELKQIQGAQEGQGSSLRVVMDIIGDSVANVPPGATEIKSLKG